MFLDKVHPDDLEFVKQSMNNTLLDGKPFNIDMRIIRTDGVEVWANATGEVERDAKGKPIRFFGMFQDISQRKRIEKQVKMSARIFDLATDSIFVHDLDGNILDFNEATSRLRGYTKDEMAKMNIHELDSPEYSALIDPRIKELLERGEAVFESVHVCKSKTFLPVEVHCSIIDLEGKKLVLAVIRDISERKKAEASLAASEAKYKR